MPDGTGQTGVFWNIILVFMRWRRILFVSFLATSAFTFLVSLFLPNNYMARATLFPPQRDTSAGIASLLGAGIGGLSSGFSMALPTFATPSDLYGAILKSRTVAERVVIKHNLMQKYGVTSTEKALDIFAGHLGVAVEPNGMLKASFEDRDPIAAAAILETIIAELNKVSSEANAAQATATRKFVEERLEQTRNELARAEEDYRKFQEEHKAVALDEQMKAIIGNIAELKGQLVLAEIEAGVLKRTFLPSHTSVRQQEAKIQEIKRQISLLEEGPADSSYDAMSIPVSEAPNVGLELARLTRELKIQSTVFELLTQQYEQAKIQEKKDTPTIQVLDPPRPPEKKSGPRRVIMALMAGFLSIALTSVIAFISEFVERHKNAGSETYRQLEKLAELAGQDFLAVRTFLNRSRNKRNG